MRRGVPRPSTTRKRDTTGTGDGTLPDYPGREWSLLHNLGPGVTTGPTVSGTPSRSGRNGVLRGSTVPTVIRCARRGPRKAFHGTRLSPYSGPSSKTFGVTPVPPSSRPGRWERGTRVSWSLFC